MILHLSKSPLVNAPGNLSKAFNELLNSESKWFYEQNYPKPIFTPYGSRQVFEEKWLDEELNLANHVIVHNFLSDQNEQVIRNSLSKAYFYRHIHSPQREGPIFLRQLETRNRDRMKCSVLCQYQQTIWPEFRALPNIVNLTPCHLPQTEFRGIISSPTHQRGGRYNAKVTRQYSEQINAFKRNFGHLYYEFSDLPLEVLHNMRSGFSVLIDEVVTGGFHLTSIEGLCSGNIVINGAKDYVINSFMSCLDITSRPPFIRSSPATIQDDLTNIALNYTQYEHLRMESKFYFEKFLSPHRLIKHWADHLEIKLCQ